MGGLGPSGAGRSPASLPLAQGRALRLKTGGNRLALSLMSGSWIGFGGRQGAPSVGPGGNLGLGRKAELVTCPKLGEGAGHSCELDKEQIIFPPFLVQSLSLLLQGVVSSPACSEGVRNSFLLLQLLRPGNAGS